MTHQTTHEDTAVEAIDWLVGRLRWERTLRDLHDRAEGVKPVAPVVVVQDDTTTDTTADATTDAERAA
jgi:hypothetical protein